MFGSAEEKLAIQRFLLKWSSKQPNDDRCARLGCQDLETWT